LIGNNRSNIPELVNQCWELSEMDKPMHISRHGNVESLKAFIDAGNYQPGEKLPAERELIGALGMTRTTLRSALDSLEREGLIWRHVGKGTFLAEPQDAPGAVNISDISRQLTPIKVMRARMSIEPAIAREAAVNASDEAVSRIMVAVEASEEAETWAEYEACDDAFHHAIAVASDNLLLVALYDQMNRVQRNVAWRKVVRESIRPPRSHTSFAEHRRIAEAIEARDPAEAREAMQKHVGSVSARLFEEI
jgi:DNA-binding FadR family transcriptional regulator